MPTLLITSMGGTGSLNLVDTLRGFDADGRYEVVGSHVDRYELAKSDLEHLYIVPPAAERQAYVEAHLRIMERHGVDLLIANSDKEVAAFGPVADKLPCRHLLPDSRQIRVVQDKFSFYETLRRHGCDTVPNIPVASREDLAKAVESLPRGERFWIRHRQGSGSLGATWLFTAEQASKWVDLWSELRGLRIEDFVVAPFLPGRDFCVATLWQDGELAVAKVYERLRYLREDTLSGMGSSPRIACTVTDEEPLENTIHAVTAVCADSGQRPHGLYQADLKCDEDGTPYVTEINIGRFPMTSPHFDRVGRYNLLQLYLQLALEPEKKLPRGVFDLDPGRAFLRGIDIPVKIVDMSRVEALKEEIPGASGPASRAV